MSASGVSTVTQKTPVHLLGKAGQAAEHAQVTSMAFADILRQTSVDQTSHPSSKQAPAFLNRWQSLRYLVTGTRPALPAFLLSRLRILPRASQDQESFEESTRLHTPSVSVTPSREALSVASPVAMDRPLDLSEYPQPPHNNGRGIHWIPTTSSPPEVVDRFVAEARRMGIRWVTFLNQDAQIGANDYLVRRLVESGIMPIMRIYTDGGAPIQGDLAALVRHYRRLGVYYFQLYNEPNLRVENQGRFPHVKRYIDLWLPAARVVAANGGLPGFGALSPQGDVDDLVFLREALREIKARGAVDVLDRAWLSVHNYGPDFLRIRQYDAIIREELGRSLPQIGTEAGVYAGPQLSEEEQVRILTEAYRYMQRREPYYFAYSYWVIANALGGGRDPAWEHQALFQVNGKVSPLVKILQAEV
ncbi:MAG TPA: hypothetical protein G4O02_15910 [Caldilineae bacterium]|nr:hypothetical protein [Caldilineae bacterium]